MSTLIVPEEIRDIEMYGETGILYSDFTDGGSTAGTYTCGFTLPADFFILQIAVVNVTGFAGDTSATLTVGDGTDADRLNTGTPSVFAAATAVQMGVPSGNQFITTAFAPVLTVTSGADFTSVSAGQLDIKVYGFLVD